MSNWILIDSIDQISSISEMLLSAKVMAVDTETTGLDPHINKLRLIHCFLKVKSNWQFFFKQQPLRFFKMANLI
jgi:hypothetical protein